MDAPSSNLSPEANYLQPWSLFHAMIPDEMQLFVPMFRTSVNIRNLSRPGLADTSFRNLTSLT